MNLSRFCNIYQTKATLIKKDVGEILNERDKILLEFRQIAKAAGFALAYGGNGFTIAKNLGISPERGDKVYNDYFKAFPGLNDYFNNKTVKKEQKLLILAVYKDNIEEKSKIIKLKVLGIKK